MHAFSFIQSTREAKASLVYQVSARSQGCTEETFIQKKMGVGAKRVQMSKRVILVRSNKEQKEEMSSPTTHSYHSAASACKTLHLFTQILPPEQTTQDRAFRLQISKAEHSRLSTGGYLQAMFPSVVFVVTIQLFYGHIIHKRFKYFKKK